MGVCREILTFCPNQLKFRFWLHKKRWHIACEFQLEIRSNKKAIAKNRLTNLYEMNSKFYLPGYESVHMRKLSSAAF